MARSPLAIRPLLLDGPQMPPVLDLDGSHSPASLQRIRRQEQVCTRLRHRRLSPVTFALSKPRAHACPPERVAHPAYHILSCARPQAIKQAIVWDSASRRAEAWSRKWTWEYSPHVIELGEDLLALALREADEKSLLQLASSCRCLRGLLLPRLCEKKARAVRAVYLSGVLG